MKAAAAGRLHVIALRFLTFFVLLAATASAQKPLNMSFPTKTPLVTGPVVSVRVQADGSSIVDGVALDSAEVVAVIRTHIRTHPDGGVAFSASRGAPYGRYIHFLDAVKAAYLSERDAVSLREFGKPYAELSNEAKDRVRVRVPIHISLAEPE